MFDDRGDFRDEITSQDENALSGDEYVDYSVASESGDDDSDDSDVNDDANDGPDHTNVDANTDEEGVQLEGELRVEPTIVHFPGRRAGEVCSRGIMTMQEYENALGGSSENPYFPFSSKTDWELAKWAKLRGPSATSFTELLNISGVSANNGPPILIISLPPRPAV